MGGKIRDNGNSIINKIYFKKWKSALTGVAQWIECQPVKQRVASSIPSQGTCLVCRPGPQLGVCKRQPHMNVSFPLFLPPFSHLSK